MPTGAPSVNRDGEGQAVTLTWTQIPWRQRGGCIRNYTVYVKNNKDSEHMCEYNAQGPNDKAMT